MEEVQWFVYRNGDRYSVEMFEYTPLSRRLLENIDYIRLSLIKLTGDYKCRFPLTELLSQDIYMERGSIVDGQIELEEQHKLEIERCHDPVYFYENYCFPNKKLTEAEKHRLRRKDPDYGIKINTPYYRDIFGNLKSREVEFTRYGK